MLPAVADPLARELYDVMASWPIYDPHSHINPRSPAARSLDEVLGYHYYTELAHSAGMPASLVDPSLDPRQRCRNLAAHLEPLANTVQYSWLLEILSAFHGVEPGQFGPDTIDRIYDQADHATDGQAWDQRVWETTRLEAVFLTNEFDDRLDGFDTSRFVPCLRTDDLVLKLHRPGTLDRLRQATNVDVGDLASLRLALGALFTYFLDHGARACAISLPPDFVPTKPPVAAAATPLRRVLAGMDVRDDEVRTVRNLVFWTLAELCAENHLPFDLMIGPIRDVYPAGVAGGRDLFDRRVSLRDYAELFNHFASTTFPVSTLSPDAGAELVAYAWIFPNVVPMGHWWYSNLPSFIADDLKARLDGVPMTKQVGYYSDAYKLEFILPKYRMYRRVLAQTLADTLVRGRGWSPEQALAVARRLLLDNPRRIFGRPAEG
jgi:glucuronate isomerase